MIVECKTASGRKAELSVNVDGARGIVIAVFDQEGRATEILHIDANNARSFQFGVKACRLGAEARAVAL